MSETLAARFWAKVDTSGDCWLWTASVNHAGYGRIQRGGRGGGIVKAHRLAYELQVGPVPEGMTIDHLCKTRACVNPAHLEVVTQGENCLRGESPPAMNARKTRCYRGHEFTPQNTHIKRNGGRSCRTCARDYARERYHQGRGREAALQLEQLVTGGTA